MSGSKVLFNQSQVSFILTHACCVVIPNLSWSKLSRFVFSVHSAFSSSKSCYSVSGLGVWVTHIGSRAVGYYNKTCQLKLKCGKEIVTARWKALPLFLQCLFETENLVLLQTYLRSASSFVNVVAYDRCSWEKSWIYRWHDSSRYSSNQEEQTPIRNKMLNHLDQDHFIFLWQCCVGRDIQWWQI